MTHLQSLPLDAIPARHWLAKLDLRLERRGAKSASQLSVAAQRARAAQHGQAALDPRRPRGNLAVRG